MALAKRSSIFDKLFRAFLRHRHAKAYAKAVAAAKMRTRSVVFCSFQGRSFSDSPKALFNQMINDSKYGDWRFVWAFNKANYNNYRELKRFVQRATEVGILSSDLPLVNQMKRMEIVRYGSRAHYKALASSKYIFGNSRLDDGICPTSSQIYLQTWHGTPLKRLGADIQIEKTHPTKKTKALIEWYKLEARKWTYVLAQNEYGAAKMKSAFRLDEIGKLDAVLVTGYPRNDFLRKVTQPELEKIRADLGIPENMKVALYAPTYRDDQHTAKSGYTYDLASDFSSLRKTLGEEWVILFRAHYFVSSKYDLDHLKGFIFDVSKYSDISDLYAVSDVLITDYSSAVFDYSNLQKPIILYAYDYEHYRDDVRGFYLPIEELPARIVTNEVQLADALVNLEEYKTSYEAMLDRFGQTYNSLEDGHVCERVLEQVIAREDLG